MHAYRSSTTMQMDAKHKAVKQSRCMTRVLTALTSSINKTVSSRYYPKPNPQRGDAGLVATISWNPRKEGVAPAARYPRTRRRVAQVHDPPLSGARVGEDVLPTSAPGKSPQTGWPLLCRDRFPTGTHHRDALSGHICGSPP